VGEARARGRRPERRLHAAGDRVGDELEVAFAKIDAAILGVREQLDPSAERAPPVDRAPPPP
jgi:hypothetical protein